MKNLLLRDLEHLISSTFTYLTISYSLEGRGSYLKRESFGLSLLKAMMSVVSRV